MEKKLETQQISKEGGSEFTWPISEYLRYTKKLCPLI